MEQEWENRIFSSEPNDDFHVDLPQPLFLEEFVRCFCIYDLGGPDSYRKSDMHLVSPLGCYFSFVVIQQFHLRVKEPPKIQK